MRKLLMLAVLALVPTVSQAQFSLGLRLGFAPAGGDADGSIAMSDLVKSQIPVQVDAMFGVSPQLALGGYLSYGVGQVGDGMQDLCDAFAADCSASNVRVGVQGIYSFVGAAPSQMVPWIGAGFGLEVLSFEGNAGSADSTGWEFLNLQGGADFKVSEKASFGPYAQISFGQYTSIEGNDIAEKEMHQWFNFGIRGKFDL
jgi:hypothetical protein